MKNTKRIKKKVQCANNPDHIFEKAYTIELDSENQESNVQAYCPWCDDFVDVTIKGKVVPDDTLFREFEHPGSK